MLEALAARADVTVSIPYEPGRAAFAALERTVEDLAALAGGAIEELGRPQVRPVPAPLEHVERELFADTPMIQPGLDGAVVFLEGPAPAEPSSCSAPSSSARSIRAPRPSASEWSARRPSAGGRRSEAVLPALGIPYAVEHAVRLGETPLGRALLGLLRFAWLDGGRGELFTFLRSPFAGLERRSVDFVEGRLRGRAVEDSARVEEESERLRGAPIPALAELRRAVTPIAGARQLLRSMTRSAWGLESPPTTDEARDDARAYQAAERALGELEALAELDRAILAPEDVLAGLERARVRPTAAGEAGRVTVLDYARARTRSSTSSSCSGWRRGASLAASGRRRSTTRHDALSEQAGASELRRARPVPLLHGVYEGAESARARPGGGERRRRAARAEPVLGGRARALRSGRDGTRDAPATALQPDLGDRVRAERAGASPGARPARRGRSRRRRGAGAANGWSRRLERAEAAFDRATRLRSPSVLDSFSARTVFSATELERFADCSSAWLVERVVAPRTIDAQPDPMLRGQVVHTALNRFYAALPKELDAERVTPENLDAALLLVRRCLDDALESGVKLDLTDLQAVEACASRCSRTWRGSFATRPSPRLPSSRGGSRCRSARSGGPRRRTAARSPRRRALALGEDRPDRRRPMERAGIVQDYKSGKGAHSARGHRSRRPPPDPSVRLALRDLVGLEPLGGIYRALAGKRVTRGMLRASARDDLPGFARDDYLDEEAFWAQVETARERAATNAQRIRAGDVQHDPRWDGQCPSWCDLWPMCRVQRP